MTEDASSTEAGEAGKGEKLQQPAAEAGRGGETLHRLQRVRLPQAGAAEEEAAELWRAEEAGLLHSVHTAKMQGSAAAGVVGAAYQVIQGDIEEIGEGDEHVIRRFAFA